MSTPADSAADPRVPSGPTLADFRRAAVSLRVDAALCADAAAPWGALLERAAAVLRARAARTVAPALRAGLLADAAQLEAVADRLARVTPDALASAADRLDASAGWRRVGGVSDEHTDAWSDSSALLRVLAGGGA